MRTLIALLGLGISFTAGCVQSGTDNNPDSKPMSKDEARASAQRVSGSGIAACTAITYLDTDGTTVVAAYVVGWDGDDDSLAMVPESWTDIFAEVGGYSQYLCLIDGTPVGYVGIEDDSEIGADCDDHNPEIGSVSVATYLDVDDDGFGDRNDMGTMSCGVDEGYSSDNTDCDDSDWDINPDAEEACDNVDNDCSGLVDDGLENFWFAPDVDGDTFGDPEGQLYACSAPAEWYVLDATDCDDTEESGYYVNPGMSEECNGIDDNCDEQVDEVYYPDASSVVDAMYDGAVATYIDSDWDTYPGTWYGFMCESQMESGVEFDYTDDCDDGNSSVNPGMSETTGNGVDDDCDAATSDVAADPDSDSDGVDDSLDCNDGNSSVYPGATEVAGNGIDDDCNGGVEVSGDGIDNDNDGVVQGEDVCVDPISGVDTLSAELYASNYTDDPNVLVTTGVVGTGTLCWATDLTVGEQWKVNAPVSGGSFWWVMLDADNIDAVTLGGLAPSAETYHSWGSGRDLVVTVPTFPTE